MSSLKTPPVSIENILESWIPHEKWKDNNITDVFALFRTGVRNNFPGYEDSVTQLENILKDDNLQKANEFITKLEKDAKTTLPTNNLKNGVRNLIQKVNPKFEFTPDITTTIDQDMIRVVKGMRQVVNTFQK